jgi:putative endopeptidase
MARLMGQSIGGFGGSFFGSFVNDDSKNPDYYALYMGQSGLGLATASSTSRPSSRRRRRATSNMSRRCSAWPAGRMPEEAAAKVVALETRSPQAHWTRAESRNRDKTYNPMTLAELQAQAPGFPWATFFPAAGGIGKAEKIVVVAEHRLPQARADLRRHRPRDAEGLAGLPHRRRRRAAPLQALRRRQFRVPAEVPAGPARAARALEARHRFAENAMGEAIGRDYVKLYFRPSPRRRWTSWSPTCASRCASGSRARVDEPGDQGRRSKKLENFGLKIGHPDKWRDYSALQVRNGDLFGNVERASQVRVGLSPQPHRPAGRRGRVGHDPADGERLLFAGEERDRLPGRDPAAALLRSGCRSGGQLRRDRRRDRPRDQPRLRRSGPQVRRAGVLRDWWTAGGRRQVRGAGGQARRAV